MDLKRSKKYILQKTSVLCYYEQFKRQKTTNRKSKCLIIYELVTSQTLEYFQVTEVYLNDPVTLIFNKLSIITYSNKEY